MEDTLAFPNIEFMMNEDGNLPNKSLLIHASIAQRAKKNLSLVIVDPVNGKALASEAEASLGADQARRTGYENCFQALQSLGRPIRTTTFNFALLARARWLSIPRKA